MKDIRKTNENTVGIPISTYAKLKVYCNKRGLIIKVWLAKLIETTIGD